jgi:hypothetical protein
MRRALSAAAAFVLLLTPATIGAQEATPTPTPPLIEQRGIVVTQPEALQRIRFRPFMPVARPARAALLAPFHNDSGAEENPANYGIAWDYVERGRTFVLRQWPRAGGSLATYTRLPGEPKCKDSYLIDGSAREVRGIGWETTRYVFALQPDDTKPSRDHGAGLKAEWHRLAQRGGCR